MHRIVILGAGYAGLATAIGLKKADAHITLINHHNYHHLTTMLHQPAAGSRDYLDLRVQIGRILPPGIDFLRGRVDTVNLKKSSVTIYRRPDRVELPFDTLVIALGWEPQYFNIPGLQETALSLSSLTNSRLAHARIEESLLALDDYPDDTWRSTFVIGGGGLTGVELAGELIDSRQELVRGLDLQPLDIRLVMIEAGPSILPGLDARLVEKTTAYLRSHGVECITGRRIDRVEGHRLILSGGRLLEAGVLFWTGGVRGSTVLEKSGFPVLGNGRLPVNAFLQFEEAPNIFVIGDCALCKNNQNEPLPPTAWLAVQHGQVTANNITRLLSGQDLKPFIPKTGSILVSIGHRHAIGIIAGRLVEGPVAAMLKDILAFRYVYQLGGFPLAARKLIQWAPYLLHLHQKVR